jgi:Tfp pilus assembly protein PilF/peroxiredoxin
MRLHTCIAAVIVLLGPCPIASAMAVREGQIAPAFKLSGLDGKSVASADWKGMGTVVVFVRPGQARSESALKDAMVTRHELGKLPWRLVVVVSGDVSAVAIREMVGRTAVKGTVLTDPDMTVYGKFGVIVTPSTLVLNREQQVVFAKASHDFEYQRQLIAKIKYATGLVDVATRNRLMHAPAEPKDKLAAKNARWVRMATSLARAGELAHARVTLERVLAGSPDYGPAWIELGFVLLRERKPAKALKAFDAGKTKSGASPLTRLGAGVALLELNRLDEAEKRLKTGLRLSPRPALTHYALGHLYERQGKTGQALTHFKAAAKTLLDKEQGGHYLLMGPGKAK